MKKYLDLDALETAAVLRVFQQLQPLFSRWAGDDSPLLTQTETKQEYSSGVGWMQFPSTDITYRYTTEKTQYNLLYSAMFNGHIGDLEERITGSFVAPNKQFSFSLDCYAPPHTLRLQGEGIDEAEAQALVQLFTAYLPVLQADNTPIKNKLNFTNLGDSASDNPPPNNDYLDNPSDHKQYK